MTAGNADKSAIATLVDKLNKVSTDTYAFVDAGTNFGGEGDDTIKVALIYKTDTVELEPGTEAAVLTDNDPSLENIGLSGEPIFNGFATSRAPLAATFVQKSTGEALTVAVNHFKSKGSSGLDDPNDPNFDQGDGQSF